MKATRTPAEAAAYLGVSVETIHAMRADNRLPSIKIGSGSKRPRYLIPDAALQRLLTEGTPIPQPEPPARRRKARAIPRYV